MSEFIKEREFGEIIQDTFSFFKDEIKPLIRVVLIFVAPFTLYGVYFMFKYQDTMEQDILNMFQSKEFSGLPGKYYIFMLFSILQQIMLLTVVSVFVKMRIKNEFISISSIWDRVYSSVFNVIYGQMLIVSSVMLVFFLAAITGLLAYLAFALIGGALYIIISMYILSFVIVFEEITPIDAIKRSLQLIRKNWWLAFGSIIVIGIIIGLFDIISSTIIKTLIQIISTGDGAAIIVLLFSSLISVILSAISPILSAHLYASFVAEKETVNI